MIIMKNQKLSQTDKQQIIEEIHEMFIDLYKAVYTGDMEVEDREDGYVLKLYLTKDFFSPICIYIQCNCIEEFLCRVREEILTRNLDTVRYFTGFQINLNDYKKHCRKGYEEHIEG